MAKKFYDADLQHNQRFSDIAGEPCQMLLPIQGYEKKPLVSLEDAVEPLVQFVPDVKRMAYVAKMKCGNPPADYLSKDESASIILYSMEWEPQEECLYYVLNATLRTENRKKLVPWFLYLKLVLTALSHLPSLQRTVFRGIKSDMRKYYTKGETVIWWGFSSCTATMDVLENDLFLGSRGTRTFFTIECINGKDIQQHSQYKSEDEILLPPGRQFKVVACLNQSGGLYMIHLKEIEPLYPLLEPVSKDTPKISTATTANSTSIIAPMGSLSLSSNKPKKKKQQEFATPDTNKQLRCEGRPCARCGECRDWYYTDPDSWKWVQDSENWNEDQRQRYRHNKFYEHFKSRSGKTCYHSVAHGVGYRGGVTCLCDDNIQIDFLF
ncbi:unnamed protein product [Adineta steineri]|uniref:NAD(P)(+)--arginine ADP-ribosyltransferase n=1 Tax=Adineta steineri TaxID=433720 RepID=A0A818XP82_9BILA|nr:unnamed protein product [Adineta steineri]CAF3741374.1 unnamed protein product [Adineta steineri]